MIYNFNNIGKLSVHLISFGFSFKKLLVSAKGLSTLLVVIALTLSPSLSRAAYNDAGTDYTTAGQGSWVEDASKQALNMVNAFVCIIKNSNGDSRPNGTWRILIDEVGCELNTSDSVAWADQIAVSTRASSSSNQEIVSYFTSADGSKYVATTALNTNANSSFGLTMLFKWYAANDIWGEGGTDITSTGWRSGITNGYGFSEITVEDYDSDGSDDTVIKTAEAYGGAGGQSYGGLIVKYGGSPSGATTAYIVTTSGQDSATYAGALNSSEYIRQTYSGGSWGAGTCYANTTPFESVYRYGVYDATTGEELAISGSFGFTYTTGGVSGTSGRGYMGHWGTWFDNRSDKLSSSNRTLSITRESDSASLTLNWAPGQLWQKNSSTETIVDGEKFEYFDWTAGTRTNVLWDSASSDFTEIDGTPYVDGTGGSISAGDWFYSERFDTWVGFLGLNAGTSAYELYVEQNDQVKTHWTGTGSQGIDVSSARVSLTCVGNCPDANISYADYSAYTYSSSANSGDTYIFTPFNESASGIYPLALYKDSVAAGNLVALNSSDSGFSTNNPTASIWTGDYVPTADLGVGTCAASTDPSAANNIYNCSTVFSWQSGLRDWGQYVFPTDSSSAAVTVSDPINFTYTHAAANDRNNTSYADSSSPFTYNWVNTDWSTGSSTTTNGEVTFVSKFNNVDVNLRYEGSGSLYGFPERQTDNGWLRLMNLTDGTTITRSSDSASFVVKALETGKFLNQQTCSGSLSVPDAFKDTSLIPSASTYTQPTQIFNSAPTVTSIHVKQGEDIIDPTLVQANE